MQYILDEEEYKEYRKLKREAGTEGREKKKTKKEEAEAEEEQEKENVRILQNFIRKSTVRTSEIPGEFGQRLFTITINEDNVDLKFLGLLEMKSEENI